MYFLNNTPPSGQEKKMANYTIKYSCGHGSVTKQLLGKIDDRYRKIAWMEQNMVCPDCYKRAKSKQDTATKMQGTLTLSYTLQGNVPTIRIVVTGNLLANKQALQAIGYVSSDDDSMEIKRTIAVNAGDCEIEANRDAIFAAVNEMHNALQSIGYTLSSYGLTNIDVIDAAISRAKEIGDISSKKEPATATSPAKKEASKKPQWFAELERNHDNPYCNGKIYGRQGGYNIYISNKQYKITDDQRDDLLTFFKK